MYSQAFSIPLTLKKIFLRFSQGYFSNISEYKWDRDITKTKIVIADRGATDIGIALSRPSIISVRGDLGWNYMVRGQNGVNSVNFKKNGIDPLPGRKPTSNAQHMKSYTDMMYGSIILNVLSKNGVQAEQIANLLFVGLTGYKDEFRKDGIFQFTGMSLGGERIIKQNSEVDLVSVPISISFLTQQSVVKDETSFNLTVYVNDEKVHEGHDYDVITNGTQIKFLRDLPDTPEVTADYVDAVTLETHTGVILETTADPLIYTIPNGGSILGYYSVLVEFQVTMTPSENADSTYQEFDDQVVVSNDD